MNATPSATAEPPNRSRWLWILPRLAFVLFLAGVGLLLWISDRADKDERRATLISDVLWLEQNLRFHLARNEEVLGRVDAAQTSSARGFESFAHSVFGYEGGLRRLMWLSPDGTVRQTYPVAADPGIAGEAIEASPVLQSATMALALGKPVYSPPYPVFGGDWQFEVHVPVSREGRIAGIAVGVYRIRSLLDDSVPWWLAERYRISILGDGGKVLGTRSKVEAAFGGEDYQISFDPPGWGLALQAVPYHSSRPPASLAVSAGLVALAVIVLWSLWVLRRHAAHRMAVEEQLRREHAFRKAMEDSLDTGMRARNLEGEIIYVNPAFCRMVGLTAAELIGRRPPMPYWADRFLDETRALNDRVLAGEGPEQGFEMKVKHSDGTLLDVLVHEAPLLDPHGRRIGWMASMVDITERKREAEAVRHQQERIEATAQLAAMGEMASSIAHELNQPLAAISSYCTGAANLARGGASSAEILPALEKAAEQAQRAGRVVHRVYGLARHDAARNERIPLAERVEAALALIEADLREQGIRVAIAGDARPVVEGDPVLLEQVLFNLLRNAADSMRDTPAARRRLELSIGIVDGYASLAVADAGCGIDPGIADKLFDPLFTTKKEGLGMGLAVCRSVVENHRGRLWFEPNPGGGTVFHLLLPLSSP